MHLALTRTYTTISKALINAAKPRALLLNPDHIWISTSALTMSSNTRPKRTQRLSTLAPRSTEDVPNIHPAEASRPKRLRSASSNSAACTTQHAGDSSVPADVASGHCATNDPVIQAPQNVTRGRNRKVKASEAVVGNAGQHSENGQAGMAQEECASMAAQAMASESKHKSNQIVFASSGDVLNPRPPLLDLGSLVRGTLVKRPSAVIKTAYVADVRLSDGTMVLAHAPSMDCAGMVTPGSNVYMTVNAPKADGSTTKTTHTIQVGGWCSDTHVVL